MNLFSSVLVMCTQIPGFYAYRRGQKLGELIGAYADRLEVCARRFADSVKLTKVFACTKNLVTTVAVAAPRFA